MQDHDNFILGSSFYDDWPPYCLLSSGKGVDTLVWNVEAFWKYLDVPHAQFVPSDMCFTEV